MLFIVQLLTFVVKMSKNIIPECPLNAPVNYYRGDLLSLSGPEDSMKVAYIPIKTTYFLWQVPTKFVIDMKYTEAKPASEVGAVPVVYIDVVWGVNFVMDGVLLLTTCWILHRPVRIWRITTATIVGASYGMLLFFPVYTVLTNWFGKAVITIVMVGIGVGWRNFLDLARVCVIFFCVSFVFAGAAIALHFALPEVTIAKVGAVAGNHISIITSMETLTLFVTLPIGLFGTQYVIRHMRKVGARAGLFYTVFAKFGACQVGCTGLMDSGNQLRDPVMRRPVIFVDADVMLPILPKELAKAIQCGKDPVLALSNLTQQEMETRFTLVPYRGAGGVQQLAVAVQPDEVVLERSGHQYPVKEHCLFAIHRAPLSIDKTFQALLHIELVTGDEKFEVSHESTGNQYEVTDSTSTVVDSNPA